MPFTSYILAWTFLFSLLSLNDQIQINKLSHTLYPNYKTQQLFSEITKSNTPSTPLQVSLKFLFDKAFSLRVQFTRFGTVMP